MTTLPKDGNVDAIAGAVAKLARAFPLDGEHFRSLDAPPAHQAQILHFSPRAAHFREVESAPGVQTFQGRVPPGWTLQLTADRPHRYGIEFLATGAKIEFVMLAGQSFSVRDNESDMRITMDDVDVPQGGLQLVPVAPKPLA